MQTPGILELVKGVFLNPDNDSRTRNQTQLSAVIESQPDLFAEQCCAEFKNKTLSAPVRVLMVTALTMTIQIKKNQPTSLFWAKLAPASKETIKMAGLESLVDDNPQVRSAAANLTALVFVVDFVSDRHFLELLGPISSNVTHEDPNVRQASVHTLGSICELLAQQKVKNIDEASFEKLVTGICLGLKNQDSTTVTAVKALSDAMGFIGVKFQRVEFADFIFEQLLIFLVTSLKASDWELFQSVLLCLGKVLKITYAHLSKYSGPLFKTLVECLATDNDKALLNLTELFIKALRLEQSHPGKYFDPIWQELLQATMNRLHSRLLAHHDAEDELVDNLLEMLRAINRIYVAPSFPVLLKFVQENWESTNEVQRTAAICTLDSLVESAPAAAINESLNQSFIWVLNCIKTMQSLRVSLRALGLLEQITTFKPEVIFSDINFQRLTDDFMAILLTPAPNENALRLKIEVSKLLGMIVDRAEGSPRFLSTTRSFSSQIQQTIFRAIEVEKSSIFIEWLFAILFSLARFVFPVDQLSDYFGRLLSLHDKILNHYQGENKTLIYETTLVNLWVVLRVLRTKNRPLQLRDKNPVAELQTLLQTLNGLFSKSGQVLPEGILLMTEILLHFPTENQGAVRNFYDSYLKTGLTSLTLPKLMENCLKSFGELFKVFHNQFGDLIGSFIEYALILIKNPDLPQNLRAPLFAFLTDITLDWPELIIPSISGILELLILGVEAVASLQVIDSDNKERLGHTKEFRAVLVELADTIIIQVYQRTPDYDAPIEAAFVNIQVALKKALESAPDDPTEFALSSLFLINDFYFKKRSDALVEVAFVKQLFAFVSKTPSQQTSEIGAYLSKTGLIK